MLEYLHLENVGPAPIMELELAPRLNLLTGDNGLGKSFLLDVAWWALTGKWPQDLNGNLTSGYRATPIDVTRRATIAYRLRSGATSQDHRDEYSPRIESWIEKGAPPGGSSLVVYVLGDGGFAVWDPARNWRRTAELGSQKIPGYVFSNQDVWNGLIVAVQDKPTQVCNGLIADWASWIRERGHDAERMAQVLGVLSALPARNDGLEVGSSFARLSLNDVRDIPTIRMGYGQDIPIVHAALGVRRIVALAYMLSWAWREHRVAAKRLGESPTNHLVLLFDEVEAHLHPRWQRLIVPALLKVVETLDKVAEPLHTTHPTSIQVLAATHSPLVLASVEPLFDTGLDRLFTLDLVDDKVRLREQPWAKQGDVVNWLVSESFGLEQGRSIEAERAIEAAEAWMRGAHGQLPAGLATQEAIHAELQRVLAGHDPFWPRWIVAAEKRGTAP